ncbi:hypothetical protein BDL97_08G068900 [Sphagnum fallax]|nr:hypothetical protein BDL97_08G068900 [Sphagnum fallax]
MAQKKKIKINNRPRQKEKKVVDIANLNEQLDLLGLKVRSVTADGNCFFRAIADQLDGQEEQHATYRQSVVDYVQEHREEFEPFVEDEVPFEEYCSTMREDGTWAGNMELQATSLVTGCNICIHQLKTPRWHIRNFESADACTLHLSYHDGEHYNSVRRLDDDGGGRAKPITIEVLHDVHGDTDAAIEFLIAEQASVGDVSPACSCERIAHSPEGSGETHHNRSCRIHCDDPEPSTSQDSCLLTKTEERSASHAAGQTNSTTLPLQGAARNKACPCGSKRKYKSCCGTQHPKPTITSISRSDEVQSNRLRKQRLKLAKDHTSEPVHSDVPRTVDMGALCI